MINNILRSNQFEERISNRPIKMSQVYAQTKADNLMEVIDQVINQIDKKVLYIEDKSSQT